MVDENTNGRAEAAATANDQAGDGALGAVDGGGADERVAKAEAEAAEYKDRALRALAEVENIRRRAEREREDTAKYAVSNFAKDLLSAVDNLGRALASVPEDQIRDDVVRNLLAGVAATERELVGALEKHGIRRVDPKGERFDHNLHQAIFEAENTGQPAGTVVQVLQPGYVIHDRLLRPAMVGVAKGEAKPVERVDTVA